MINLGTYHYFRWYKSPDEIETDLITNLFQFDIILTGYVSVEIYNAKSGASFTGFQTSHLWSYNGQNIKSTRITFNMQNGVPYYMVVDDEFYSNIFMKTSCGEILSTSNSCANIYHDWIGQDPLPVSLYETIQLEPSYSEETVSVVGLYGEIKKTVTQKIRHRMKFISGMGMINMLNGVKNNDTNTINGVSIKNIEYEIEETSNEDYATFTLSYELVEQFENANDCCEIINIDDILSPENTGGSCTGFSATITESNGTLSVNILNPPTGTPTYKWYLNGGYFSGANSVSITDAGDYRVDIKVADCKTSAFYYISDPCSSFSIDLYTTGNEINGDLNNLPDGETPVYNVVFEGATVGSALPFAATETGTYYVYITTESCNASKGIYVKIETEDCSFTVDINEDGNELGAITDALSPTYFWEKETKDGRIQIGTTPIITMNGKGIYINRISI